MKLTGIIYYKFNASHPSAFILCNGLLQARNTNRQISLLAEEDAVLATQHCRATNFVFMCVCPCMVDVMRRETN